MDRQMLPVAESMKYSVFRSGPPKAMLVTVRPPLAAEMRYSGSPKRLKTQMQPLPASATYKLPASSTARSSIGASWDTTKWSLSPRCRAPVTSPETPSGDGSVRAGT